MQDPTHTLIYVLACAGAAITINVVLVAVAAVRRGRGLATFAPRWSMVDLWWGAQALIPVLVVLITPLLLLIGFYAHPLGLDKLDFTNQDALMASPAAIAALLLPSTILQNVACFTVPTAFINLRYGLPLRAIGLPFLPRPREVRAGVLLGILAIIASNLLGTGLRLAAEQFQSVTFVRHALDYEKTNQVAGMMQTLPKLGWVGLVLGVLTVGVAAPFGEEMLFRGFVFTILKRRLGLGVGLVVSALLFTAPHTYSLSLLPVFLLGLVLAWTYHNTGSLWVPIIIHATNNTVGVLLAYFSPNAGV